MKILDDAAKAARLEEIKFDFRPENGTLLGAMMSALIAAAIFVAVPYIIVTMVTGNIEDAGGWTDAAWSWIYDMMKYSIILILLAIPVGFYRAGSYAKVPFRVIFALYLGAWLWVASHGGVFTMTLPDPGTISASVSSIKLDLDITYIVYVLIIICIARMFLAFAELGGHRKKYLEALEKKKDTMSRRKARRLSSGK